MFRSIVSNKVGKNLGYIIEGDDDFFLHPSKTLNDYTMLVLLITIQRPSKEGFDIVIGNPPYINIERIENHTKKLLFQLFSTCKGRTDVYVAFMENALQLLSKCGICSFIIPYAFTNQNYGEPMRRFLLDKYSVDEILDTSGYYVFDNASVKNIIIRLSNNSGHSTAIKIARRAENFEMLDFESRTIDPRKFSLLKNCRFETKDFEPILRIKHHVENRSCPLGKIFFVGYGVRVNHKTDSTKPKSFYVHANRDGDYKPFTEGKNIERFVFSQYGWLNYQPTEHYNPMFPELFENEKIMFIRVVSQRLRFAYDTANFYNSHTVINCVKLDKLKYARHLSAKRAIVNGDIVLAKTYSTKFILGVLNSTLINWYFFKFLSDGINFFPDDAKSLPIPTASPARQAEVISLVDTILAAKKFNPQADTSALESQIDQLVYSLYNLTEDEIKTVESI